MRVLCFDVRVSCMCSSFRECGVTQRQAGAVGVLHPMILPRVFLKLPLAGQTPLPSLWRD